MTAIFCVIVVAAGFEGEDTLKNMRETIMKHVLSSNHSMFEQAKEEILSRLRDLMVCHILCNFIQ